MTSTSTMRLFLFILSICTCTRSAIVVSRCCQQGEIAQVQSNQLICTTPNLDDSLWNPKIFSIRKGIYLPIVPSSWRVVGSKRPACGNFNASVITKDYFILESGLLFYNEQKVPRDQFCVENNAVLVCLQAPPKSTIIRKCCGSRGVYNKDKSRCVVHNETIPFTANNVSLIGGFPECGNDSYIPAGLFDKFDLLEDGGLKSKSGGMISADLFCVEYFLDDLVVPHVLTCPNIVLVGKNVQVDWKLRLYPIGLIISVIFLIATLATGFLLPSSHHVLHWRCQTNYVTCLLVGDACLAVTQLGGHQITGKYCLTIASVMHFFFLAAFFWLNTMCFNIWWTFRDLRPANLEKGQEACRLRLYKVYAWGLPLAIAGIGAVINQLPKEEGYDFLRPRFCENGCWFYGDMEIFTYFFGPVGLLLTINLILFGLTTRELTCGLWKREVVKSNTERAALGRICLKLVVVMGVSWVADILSWAAGGPQELWYATDIINTLQGLFIFIVIGCQPQVWTALKRMWCLRRSDVNWGTTSRTTGNGNSVTNHQSTVPLETSC